MFQEMNVIADDCKNGTNPFSQVSGLSNLKQVTKFGEGRNLFNCKDMIIMK